MNETERTIRGELSTAHAALQRAQDAAYADTGSVPLRRRLALNRAQDTTLRLILWLDKRRRRSA